jgi:hypothetical protein
LISSEQYGLKFLQKKKKITLNKLQNLKTIWALLRIGVIHLRVG